jgi:hypothetical protein
LTADEYLAALDRLGLTRAGQATAEALGVTVRNVQRYAAGQPVPAYVEIILGLMLERQGAKNNSRKTQKPVDGDTTPCHIQSSKRSKQMTRYFLNTSERQSTRAVGQRVCERILANSAWQEVSKEEYRTANREWKVR